MSGDGPGASQTFSPLEAVPPAGGPAQFLGQVKAISTGASALDVYAVGTDTVLYHKRLRVDLTWDPVNLRLIPVQVWSPWDWLGNSVSVVGTPAVTTWGEYREDIFVRGTDNNLHQKVYDAAGTWWPSQYDYYSLGGPIVGSPAAISPQLGRYTVVANGPNSHVSFKMWNNGPVWYPTNDTFGDLAVSSAAGVSTLIATPLVANLGSGFTLFSAASSDILGIYTNFKPTALTYTVNSPSVATAFGGWLFPYTFLGGTFAW